MLRYGVGDNTMSVEFKDYFLPGYIGGALGEAGKLRVEERPFLDGLTVHHLVVDREVLQIVGRALRNRRNDLMKGVDLRDSQGLANRLAGLGALSAEVSRADSPLRKEALEVLPLISGFSREMTAVLIDSFAGLMTSEEAPTLGQMPTAKEAARAFTKTPHGYVRYYPGLLGTLPPLPIAGLPQVVTNIAAGNVAGITIMQAMLAMLVGAASLEKNASAEPYFGPRFLQELARLEAASGLFPLSDLMVLVTFPGTDHSLLAELIHQGDHLQVTGGHDSKRDISKTVRRLRLRGLRDLKRRVSGHWHKVSFDIVGSQYLGDDWLDTVAFGVAFDNSMFNTQGCLSAQQVFVEGNEAEVMRFSEHYIEHMRAILQALPKGPDPGDQLWEMYEWYENRRGVTILTTLSDLREQPFFTVYDGDVQDFTAFNALNRSIIIRRVDCLEEALPRLLGTGEKEDLLQSCGVAVAQQRLAPIAELLGRAGVNRIVAVGNIWDMHLGAESWDGYMSPYDLIVPQPGHWTTISFHQMGDELRRVRERNEALLAGVGPRSH
jgi:hypothetical protein